MASTPSRTGRQFQRYDQGCRQVVGCIPYRYKKTNQFSSIGGTHVEELEFLLISSQKSERMMFPKGGWEIDESMEQAASRETLEEAGAVGIVEHKLGNWSFKSKSQGTFHDGHMFPLRVTELLDSWPEENVRRRAWMTAKEAREACDHLWMKEALDRLVCRLKHPQPKEEENQRPCGLEFLTEEPRMSIVSQNGEEEVDRCLVS
ncbi:nudix hydrolase 17, mitochondrial-like [Cornus florida]|uniref:nudix hydrolase 17, mitochondrial-like n=1 Tax=Cornus florida TaxID=4283 RepID=UPI00289DD631|nr:nudix hydrolase 17, mitochondrial-like [Cornus florida]